MASAFNLLTSGGARFDKNRFKKDIDLFTGTKPTNVKKGKGKERATDSTALPSSLNLFHTAQPKSKSAGKQVEAESECEDESGSESDASSSSSASIPAPPKQKITLSGADPLPKSLHANLPSLVTHLPSASGQPLLNALQSSNIHSLWGVQCAVAGCILEKRDTMCVAPTGSGKTLAYALPTLVRLQDPARSLRESEDDEEREKAKGIRALVLVPTHDLAVQIEGVVKAVTRRRGWRVMVLTKATQKAVCESAPGTGVSVSAEGSDSKGEGEDEEAEQEKEEDGESEDEETDDKKDSSSLGIDILIATPERLHHLLQEGKVSLSSTTLLTLDESDRLLSSDFLPQITPIVEACTNENIQKCFLSATMPAGAEEIAKGWLKDGGVRVVVGLKDSAVTSIDQSLLYTASESGKTLALLNLLNTGNLPYPSLIFTQSIERAEELYKLLALEGMRVECLHGQKGNKKREEVVDEFRKGEVWCLVVTEVLARGMDFRGVKVVVNYDFPQTVQSYIHRIGRTGRAGRPGKAITFFSNEDAPYLKTIANVLRTSGCPVPEYMLNLPNPSKNTKKNLAKAPPKRKAVGGGGRDVGKEEGRKKRAMISASRKKTKE